jgi:hypothetical protein
MKTPKRNLAINKHSTDNKTFNASHVMICDDETAYDNLLIL